MSRQDVGASRLTHRHHPCACRFDAFVVQFAHFERVRVRCRRRSRSLVGSNTVIYRPLRFDPPSRRTV